MTVYRLIDDIVFPPPEHSEPDGLLALGGDLSTERLLLAYRMGIFPWYSEGQPILWWSPDPRLLLEPKEFHISKRLGQRIKQKFFKVTFDQAFSKVIEACSSISRKGQQGTWITSDMKIAYIHLHRLGYAHSAESWFEGKLVGGIYGVSLGRCFFGESMFHYKSDASKVALAALIQKMREFKFDWLDAQMTTEHLMSLGAKEIPRQLFLKRLKKSLRHPTIKGPWNGDISS